MARDAAADLQGQYVNILVVIGLVFGVSCLTQSMVPINARNGQVLGAYWATVVYLVVGAVASLILIVVRQETAGAGNLGALPAYVYLNSFFNILVIVAAVEIVPRIGVGAAWSAGVVGQITTALMFSTLR